MLYSVQSLRYVKFANEEVWIAVSAWKDKYKLICRHGDVRQDEMRQDSVCEGDWLTQPIEWYVENRERLNYLSRLVNDSRL